MSFNKFDDVGNCRICNKKTDGVKNIICWRCLDIAKAIETCKDTKLLNKFLDIIKEQIIEVERKENGK